MTSSLLVILAHGHAGRPGRKRHDLGAAYGDTIERDLVPWYMASIERTLTARGATVKVIRAGSLEGRQAQAIAWGREWLAEHPEGLVLYLSCHMDANPDREPAGMVLHDKRSALGARLARHIRLELADVPDLGGALVFPAHAGDWTSRSFNCLRHVWKPLKQMTAVVLEPLLVTGQHDHLLGPEGHGLALVGEACARGVLAMAHETLGLEAA